MHLSLSHYILYNMCENTKMARMAIVFLSRIYYSMILIVETHKILLYVQFAPDIRIQDLL